MSTELLLRDVIDEDLPIFFQHQRDPDAVRMAAAPSRDRQAFDEHWAEIRRQAGNTIKTVVFEGQVAGNVLSFNRLGIREVGYWLGKAYWGKGIATRALAEFLRYDKSRPLYARVACTNPASVRVLEKCGFRIVDEDIGSLGAPGDAVEESILKLNADS